MKKSDIVSPENALTSVEDGSIRFHHVDFAYSAKQKEPVLTDIDISIASGENHWYFRWDRKWKDFFCIFNSTSI